MLPILGIMQVSVWGSLETDTPGQPGLYKEQLNASKVAALAADARLQGLPPQFFLPCIQRNTDRYRFRHLGHRTGTGQAQGKGMDMGTGLGVRMGRGRGWGKG